LRDICHHTANMYTLLHGAAIENMCSYKHNSNL
jgi:hypothetical protein